MTQISTTDDQISYDDAKFHRKIYWMAVQPSEMSSKAKVYEKLV